MLCTAGTEYYIGVFHLLQIWGKIIILYIYISFCIYYLTLSVLKSVSGYHHKILLYKWMLGLETMFTAQDLQVCVDVCKSLRVGVWRCLRGAFYPLCFYAFICICIYIQVARSLCSLILLALQSRPLKLLLPNPALLSCCSPVMPAFGMGHFVSAKLYCGIIHPCCML